MKKENIRSQNLFSSSLPRINTRDGNLGWPRTAECRTSLYDVKGPSQASFRRSKIRQHLVSRSTCKLRPPTENGLRSNSVDVDVECPAGVSSRADSTISSKTHVGSSCVGTTSDRKGTRASSRTKVQDAQPQHRRDEKTPTRVLRAYEEKPRRICNFKRASSDQDEVSFRTGTNPTRLLHRPRTY